MVRHGHCRIHYDDVLGGGAAVGEAATRSAINTILSVTGVDMKTLRPLPTVAGHSTPGGYSYAAVKPIALRMVSELKRDAAAARSPPGPT